MADLSREEQAEYNEKAKQAIADDYDRNVAGTGGSAPGQITDLRKKN